MSIWTDCSTHQNLFLEQNDCICGLAVTSQGIHGCFCFDCCQAWKLNLMPSYGWHCLCELWTHLAFQWTPPWLAFGDKTICLLWPHFSIVSGIGFTCCGPILVLSLRLGLLVVTPFSYCVWSWVYLWPHFSMVSEVGFTCDPILVMCLRLGLLVTPF